MKTLISSKGNHAKRCKIHFKPVATALFAALIISATLTICGAKNGEEAKMETVIDNAVISDVKVVLSDPTEEVADIILTAEPVEDLVQKCTGPAGENDVDVIWVGKLEQLMEMPISSENRIDNCTITHYCTERYAHICGTGTGITASGREVVPGLSCAVDPDVIPLGSTVVVDYGNGDIDIYRADDIGGGVDGHHLDLAVKTHSEAWNLGVTTATVYWMEAVDE